MSLHRLEELYLNHNNVSSVRRNDFSQMSATEEAFPNLRKLILDHNSISHVEPAAFRFVLSLRKKMRKMQLTHQGQLDPAGVCHNRTQSHHVLG